MAVEAAVGHSPTFTHRQPIMKFQTKRRDTLRLMAPWALAVLVLMWMLPAIVVAQEKLPKRNVGVLSSNLQTSFNLASTLPIERQRRSYNYNTHLGTSTLLRIVHDHEHEEQPCTTPESDTTSDRTTDPSAMRSRHNLAEYEIRKEDWANRYTSLQSLRETFGTNKNRLWGDLDAASARRLYKTLLPKALLELVQVGVQPEDLAPLAYQARVVAKLYARERCQLPSRILAALFDGFRTLRRYGRFQPVGMSYHQVWAKYEAQVLEDLEEAGIEDNQELIDANVAVRKICLRILESSCRTNTNVDKWVLPSNPTEDKDNEELMKISQTLENDVRKLLHPISVQDKPSRTLSPLVALNALWRLLTQLGTWTMGKSTANRHQAK